MKIGIGADVGGTHITSACIDFSSKQILEETICTTQIDNQSNAQDLLNKFINTILKSYELRIKNSELRTADNPALTRYSGL